MDARLPDEMYEYAKDLLPPLREPGPQGGRRPIDHFTVLKVIWFVMTVGCRWKDVPSDLGCSGETARTRLRKWEELGIWNRLHEKLLTELNRRKALNTEIVIVDSSQIRAFGGGEETGPSPVDRRKKGTKLTLVADPGGAPMVLRAASANTSDHCEILSAIAAVPKIRGRRGRPRSGPRVVYADAGYDSDSTRDVLKMIKITSHIRRRNAPHGSHLGKVRWVVERSFSWLKGLRRLRVRYDRSTLTLNAWMHLAQAAICLSMLLRTSN